MGIEEFKVVFEDADLIVINGPDCIQVTKHKDGYKKEWSHGYDENLRLCELLDRLFPDDITNQVLFKMRYG